MLINRFRLVLKPSYTVHYRDCCFFFCISRYQQQFENVTYLCKACYKQGREIIVQPTVETSDDNSWLSYSKYANYARYAWSGYSITCPHCGEIYRSRQFWYVFYCLWFIFFCQQLFSFMHVILKIINISISCN